MHDQLLFAKDVFAHLVASMSGVVSFIFAMVEHARGKKIESWAFFAIGALCLIIAFDLAWQNEHDNVQVLIGEKSSLWQERDFWKQQSYDKDATLRTRDDLLAKNFTTLSQTEQSLSTLSTKLLEVTKPEPLRIIVAGERLPWYGGNQPHEMIMLGIPNKMVGAVDADVICDKAIDSVRAAMLGHDLWTGKTPDRVGENRFHINITSPIWTPTQPLVVYVRFKNELANTCELRQQ
jgi:hypothetical protein